MFQPAELLLFQGSWKAALRTKFKMERLKLTSDETRDAYRAKFGRPGVSGRKPKRPSAADDDLPHVPIKTARFKVQ